MNNIFGNLAYVCREIWESIGIAQRVSIVLIGFCGMLAVGVVMYLGTRPNWQILYADLDAETAAEVYELAKDDNVPVRLKNSGRTILVPFEHVNDLRLKAAKNGCRVDSKGVGLELFDDVKLGLTELQQRVGYQRALQGELQRMISNIPGVADAQVILVMARQRALRNSDTRSKASVFVVMDNGETLSSTQVMGIRHMVAGAAEGVEVGDVTVADNQGQLLARGESGTTPGMAGDTLGQMEIRERLESVLREKAEAILRPIVGMDAVAARVTTELDFNIIEKTVEEYDSERTVVISERSQIEENTRNDAKSGGVPGTGSNLVSVRNPTAGTTGDTSENTMQTLENEYAVPSTTEKTTDYGPRVKGLSVAVTIASRDDGKTRSQEELESYRQLVISAVGAVTENSTDGIRNDTVTVVEGKFLERMAKMDLLPPPPSTHGKILKSIERYISSPVIRPLAGAVLLIFLYRIFGNTFRGNSVERIDLADSNSILAEGNEDEQTMTLPEETIDRNSQQHVMQTMDSKPELVAGAIEAWMAKGN